MKLVIVQGGAAAGKTTLAKKLAKDLKYKTFFKDDFKEEQFNKLVKKPNLVKWFKLERESWEEIYNAIAKAKNENISLVIEGNFKPNQRYRLQKLLSKNVIVVEIFCFTKGWLGLKRYVQRNESNNRHKGHRDRLWYPVVFLEVLFAQLGLRLFKPLRLSNNLIKVNTSSPQTTEYDKILSFIKKAT